MINEFKNLLIDLGFSVINKNKTEIYTLIFQNYLHTFEISHSDNNFKYYYQNKESGEFVDYITFALNDYFNIERIINTIKTKPELNALLRKNKIKKFLSQNVEI